MSKVSGALTGSAGCRPERRLPGLEADAGDRDARVAGRRQRHAPAVAGDGVALGVRGPRASPAAVRPRYRRSARCRRWRPARPSRARARAPGEFQLHALVLDLAAEREAEFELRRRTIPGRGRSRCCLRSSSTSRKSAQTIMRQHEAIVQRRAPADEAAVERVLPEARDEGADQQLLREAHARIGRHLEAAELDQAEPAGRAVGRIQLVDADFASDACCR